MRKQAEFLCICLLGFEVLTGCATSNPTGVRPIHSLFPSSLRVRRPAGPGASPLEEPGGTDYQSHPAPNATYDCEPLKTLFIKLDLKKVGQCIASVSEAPKVVPEVTYVLERGFMPLLKLVSEEETPGCLKKELPIIPVPREIFFQSAEQGELNCYSARLDIEADRPLDVKLPIHGYELKIPFPVKYPYGTDEELVRLLGSWALSPIWDLESRAVAAKLVPNALCRRCLGEKNMVNLKTMDPAGWP